VYCHAVHSGASEDNEVRPEGLRRSLLHQDVRGQQGVQGRLLRGAECFQEEDQEEGPGEDRGGDEGGGGGFIYILFLHLASFLNYQTTFFCLSRNRSINIEYDKVI
jgi:hypothetical protein